MSEPLLRVGTAGPVASIRLNRPRKRNALSMDLMRDLIAVLEGIGTNREVAAVILAAEGSAFCAGHDLNEMVDRNVNEYRQIFDLCTDLMTVIQRIPQPVIAQVHGMATAAGCQLVAACDLVVASENARFSETFIRRGLIPADGSCWQLPRMIGLGNTFLLQYTGQVIDAQEALRLGIASRVTPHEELLHTTMELASGLASGATYGMALTKRLIQQSLHVGFEESMELAGVAQEIARRTEDHREGVRAFVEKRSPRFTGR